MSFTVRFDVPSDTCVVFYLLIDGQSLTDRITLGRARTRVASSHIRLCP
jgi:hypothetical protein